MTSFPGFTMPDELRLLGEQIRRFVQRRDHSRSSSASIPTPRDLPTRIIARLSAKTKAAGLWGLGAPEQYGGGGLDTFSMCVALEEMSQHRMGLYNPGCGVFGRYPPPAIWAGSKAQIEKYAVPDHSRRGEDVLRHHRAVRRLRSRGGHPDPRGEARRPLGAQRAQGLHLARPRRAVGRRVRAHRQGARGARASPASSSSKGTPGFTAHAHPHHPHLGHSQRRGLRGLRDPRGEPDRRRKGRGSTSPSISS